MAVPHMLRGRWRARQVGVLDVAKISHGVDGEVECANPVRRERTRMRWLRDAAAWREQGDVEGGEGM